ncbi:MAG TPA: hypothetical protein VE988_00265 [Gemmataceae bacterium]|nr:hypothetical protein [Gemmataceae bacterium]
MNPDQVIGVVRQFLPFVGGLVSMFGWLKAGEFEALSGAVVAAIGPVMLLGSAVWSVVSKTDANLVKSAAAVPGVRSIDLRDNPEGRALAPVTPNNVNVTPSPIQTGPLGVGGMRP